MTEQDGEVAQRCTWNTDIRICGPCVCAQPQCLNQLRHVMKYVTTTLDLDLQFGGGWGFEHGVHIRTRL